MAIAFTRRVSFSTTTDATSFASSSWTPTANEAHLAVVVNRRATAVNAPTLSGNGLTWVQIATLTYNTGILRCTTFYAIGVASPTTGAITADFAGQTQDNCHIAVDELTDALDSAPVNTGNTQSGTVVGTSVTCTSLSALGSGNAVYAGCAAQEDANQTAGSGMTGLGTSHVTTSATALLSEYDASGATLAPSFSSGISASRIILAVEVQTGTVVQGLTLQMGMS